MTWMWVLLVSCAVSATPAGRAFLFLIHRGRSRNVRSYFILKRFAGGSEKRNYREVFGHSGLPASGRTTRKIRNRGGSHQSASALAFTVCTRVNGPVLFGDVINETCPAGSPNQSQLRDRDIKSQQH